jgi:outer membrane receptor protein involved in Fe transport
VHETPVSNASDRRRRLLERLLVTVLTAANWAPCLGAEAAAGSGADLAAAAGELPTIEVTASLPTAPPLPPTPIFIVDHDALERSGATLDEVLQRIPAFGFQGVNQNQNAGGYGASFLDLRNLNFNRTLVLIDGRRVVLSGIQTDEAVDVANIPAALVERVEVLPSGSAPKYGADAVAGVVNIVLKRDLTGLIVTAGSGISGRADASANDVSAVYGVDLPGGNLTIGASWMHRDPLPQSNRAWAQDPITAASFGPDGSVVAVRGSEATLAGHAVGADLGSAAGGGYDPSTASYLRGGLQRATLDAIGHEQVADRVAAFMEFGFSDKLATTQLPPAILGLTGTEKHPDGFVIPADNPFNPYGEDVTLQRVLGEVGDERTSSRSQVLRVVAGLEGTGPAGIGWSVSVNHGESRTTYSVSDAVNLTRALQTVSTDPADCPGSEGCIAADYFGVGSVSPAAVAYLRYDDLTVSEYRENALQASMNRAMELLPAGEAQATLGAEYRREYGQTVPSAVVQSGDQAGGDAAVTAGGYSSREVFLDLDLPLLRSVAHAGSLDAQASARHVNTSLFGGFSVWKLDLSWAPVEGLALRAGLGTARRVPAITEAFGGSTIGPLEVTDPCDAANGLLANPVVAANCRSLGLAPTFRQSSALLSVANGGNPDLKPEASRNHDVGIRFAPSALADFSLSVDYYDIAVRDAIDSLTDADPNYITDTCLSSPNLSSSLCKMIARIPSGPSAGQISRIDAPDENIGAIDTDGIDLGVHYGMALEPAATLRLDWENAVLLDYRVQETPGAPYIQEAGTFPNLSSAGSLTRYRSVLTTQYETARWTGSWSVRYVGGARLLGADASTPYSRAPGIFYNDISIKCLLAPATLTLGVDNLLNQAPPTLIDGVSNTNLNTYDVLGRFFFARAAWAW